MDLVSVTRQDTPSRKVQTTAAASADGRRVLFSSDSTRLTPGAPDDNCYQQMFVRDRRTDTTRLVSSTSDGQPAHDCGSQQDGTISGDGRTVAFFTEATNLAPPGAPPTKRVFFKDLDTGQLSSVPAPYGAGRYAGTRANIWNTLKLSYDARYALVNGAFPGEVGTDTNFLLDRTTGQWQQICALALTCRSQALSSDGRYAAYTHTGYRPYLYDRVTGSRRLVPPGPAGPDAILFDGAMTFSQDGRLLFCTWFLNDPYRATVVAYRVSDLTVIDTIRYPGLISAAAADASGRYLAVTADPRGRVDVDDLLTDAYIYDRQTRNTLLVSRTQKAEWARGHSPARSMTADGRGVLITSDAAGLFPGRPRTDYNFDAYFAYRSR